MLGRIQFKTIKWKKIYASIGFLHSVMIHRFR